MNAEDLKSGSMFQGHNSAVHLQFLNNKAIDSIDSIVLRIERRIVIVRLALLVRGQVHRALHDAKGRERPRVAFRAAGWAKRWGRSRPFDVLACVPVLPSSLRIGLYALGLWNRGRKTDQKTVRKTEFSTVFHYFNLFT
jgi:hypothetical protein